jgi:zinc transport system permease protein
MTEYYFLIIAIAAAVLASIPFGIVGTIVVTKRISYVAGAISHSILGGFGLGLYMNKVLEIKYITPTLGAFVFAVISALAISYIRLKAKDREDTILGAIWAFGMSLGLILIFKTPGYVTPSDYLFGNILLVSANDLALMLVLNIVLLFLFIGFYKNILAVCFDPEFAKIRGINFNLYYTLMLVIIAVTVVLLVNMVGIIMVIAMLSIPAVIANKFTKHFWQMAVYATIISLIVNVLGIYLSYILNLPAGATIVMFTSIIYFVVTLIKASRY